LIFSNIAVYKAIADEAHQKMHELMDAGRRPRSDGSPGWIITYDQHQRSFKQSMIVIVFVGMWIEALMHLLIVREKGKEIFNKYDSKPYEVKLQLLGCSDKITIDCATRFRKIRRELVHEKAYFDNGEIKRAQDEADNAYALLIALHSKFKLKQKYFGTAKCRTLFS